MPLEQLEQLNLIAEAPVRLEIAFAQLDPLQRKDVVIPVGDAVDPTATAFAQQCGPEVGLAVDDDGHLRFLRDDGGRWLCCMFGCGNGDGRDGRERGIGRTDATTFSRHAVVVDVAVRLDLVDRWIAQRETVEAGAEVAERCS